MSLGVENTIAKLWSVQGIVTVDISAADQPLSPACRAIMVSVAGDVKVTMIDGSVGVLPALVPGMMYPVVATLIWKVGTIATGIKALL